MAGRFSTHQVAAPALVPAVEEAFAETISLTGLPEPAPEPPPPPAANSLLTDKLLDAKVRLHRRLIEEINLSALEKLPEEEMRAHILQLVTQYVLVERLALNTQELNDFVAEIIDEMTGLGPLEPLLKDASVNDILINGHECVYVERRGILEPTGVRFKDEAHLLRIINKIVSAVGRRVDESHPMCDARLLDGSRVNVAVRPVAIDGPLMSIRKFSKKPFNLNKLVDVGALRPQMAELLAAAIWPRIEATVIGRPAMPIICSKREMASRGVLAWTVAIEPSWPVFMACSMSKASSPRHSPRITRSGRMRSAFLTRSRWRISPLPSMLGGRVSKRPT